MNRSFKRILSICLSVLLLSAALPLTATATNYSGKLGDYVSWNYNDIRHDLQINGHGPMEDYDTSPFWGRRGEITSVTVSGGVTHIGDNAFNGLSKVTSIQIASGVQSVGKHAFSGTAASSITLPDSVRSIGNGALTCCTDAVHIPRFTQDIGENILYLRSTTVYICSTTEDCFAKEYADAHGYTFKVCTHPEHTHNYLLTESVEPTDTEIGTDTYTCSVCGNSCITEIPIIGHTTEHQTENATCTQDGREYDRCTVCGRELNVVKTTPALGHQFDMQVTQEPTYTHMGTRMYTCTVCGYAYTEDIPEKDIHVDSSYSAGDVIEFGSYPKEKVTDETLLSELQAAEKEWHSYGYYSGNDGFNSMKPSDYMRYADFTYEGVRYRAVLGSRPKSSLHRSTAISEENTSENARYYIYAPLEWIVVDPDSGWLICNEIVDAQPFCNEVYSAAASIYSTDPTATYANGVGENASNYKTSSIRAWLNETFWDLAFTGSEQNYIVDTSFPDTGSKTEEAETLSDKVFLCSRDDALGEVLPVAAKLSWVNCTPYAIGQGAVNCQYVTHDTDPVYETGSTWWLRTASGTNAASAIQGYTGSPRFQYVWFVRCVRPSIRLTSIDQALHDHSFTSHVSKEPTCTNAGVRTYLCSGCGYRYTEPIAATGHTTVHKTEPATCTEAGRAYDECSVCGEVLNETVIPAAGHMYNAVATTATCTTGGFTTYTCSVCGDTYTDDRTDALGHDFGAWQSTTTPTCTEPGERTRACSRCGAKETQTVEAAGHMYNAVATTATCTTGGFTTYTCSACGDSYTDNKTDALGHDFGAWQSTTTPTCTEPGENTRTCSRCGEKETQTVDAAGHAYNNAVVTDPTCTEAGFTTYTCSVCGDRYTDKPVPAAGHQYTDKVVLPTCTQTGCTVHTCTVCGEQYSDTLVSALGHDWSEKSRTNAACTSDGEIVFVCSRDASHTRTQTLPALGHAYTHIVTPPTCTKDGFTTHTCAVCGESFSDTVVPASGHRYDATVVSPTCTKDGYTVYTCTVCGKSYTGVIMPALGHQLEDGVCVRCGLAVNWEFTVADGCVTLTKYTADEPYVTVPDTLGGSSVTAIADGAFRDNETVEYVCIPDSVRSIGEEAFTGCAQLREVFVGRGVLTVGLHAFAQCPCLAIFCTLSPNVDLRADVFGVNDPRLTCTVPADSKTAAFLERSALHFRTFSYPVKRNDQYVIAFSGETVLYGDLEYFYWNRLVHLYPDAVYLRFDKLTFDGISSDLVGDAFDESFVDRTSENLTFKNVYVSVQVQDETITFERLAQLLESGQISLAVSFDSEDGERLTIFQKIGGMMQKVFNALTKLLNSIIRIFKKK